MNVREKPTLEISSGVRGSNGWGEAAIAPMLGNPQFEGD
jgi:hypothetical protein